MAFRFFFIYLGLFILVEVLIFLEWLVFNPVPSSRIYIDELPPFREITAWVATHIFHMANASGPITEYNGLIWVEFFWFLVVAFAGTLIWSIVDRGRQSYTKLYAWFRVVVIVVLAGVMFAYGTAKVIPVQMWFPRLSRLLERFGDFSPMAVLWNSIGAAPGCEFFTGCAEVAGGLLLVIPRTTTLGALICAADMLNVSALNMTYDVNVKSISSHLLLMAVFLLAPDAKGVGEFLPFQPRGGPIFGSTSFPESASKPDRAGGDIAGRPGLARRWPAFGCAAVWNRSRRSPKATTLRHLDGGGFLSGWTEPLAASDRRRAMAARDFSEYVSVGRREEIFQHGKFANAEEMVTYGMNDEEKNDQIAVVERSAGTIQIYADFPPKKFDLLSFTQPAPGQLILDGTMNGHKIHARMQLFAASKFFLVTHGGKLNWVGSGAWR